jgi:hypothetical protein
MSKFQQTSNIQIKKFFKYYFDLPSSPNYAILLDGPWGSGKSFFIEELKQVLQNKKSKIIHVSLYGVDDLNKLEEQVYNQFNSINKKVLQLGGKLIFAALKEKIGVDLEKEVSKLQKIVDNAVFIFDDFERCALPPEQSLGYINGYVEHGDNKVVIISNSKEIDKNSKFSFANEKVIGRSFTLTPEYEISYISFCKNLTNLAAKKFLNKNKSVFISALENARHENLRTLRYGLMEIERLFKILPKEIYTQEEFIKELANTLFLLCLEIKSGNLESSNLKSIQEDYNSIKSKQAVHQKSSKDINQILTKKEELTKESIERVFGDRLYASYSNLEFLYHFFSYGSVNSDVINNMVTNSHYFQTKNTPSWKKICSIWDITENDFNTLYPEVLNKFKNQEYTNHGEFIHVASILIYLARHSIIPIKLKAMLKIVHSVRTNMEKTKSITNLKENESREPRFYDSYSGLAYADRETPEVKTLIELINNYHIQCERDFIMETSKKLADIALEDPMEFYEILTSPHGNRKIYKIAVLSQMDVKDFLKSFFETEGYRYYLQKAFLERAQNVSTYPDLVHDLPWLEELKKLLAKDLNQKSGLRRHRAKILSEQFIQPAIEILKEYKDRTKSLTVLSER